MGKNGVRCRGGHAPTFSGGGAGHTPPGGPHPDDIRVADLDRGELGLALIAGMVPAQSGWEDTGLAVSRHAGELLAVDADIKLLLVIHDGMGNDHELLT